MTSTPGQLSNHFILEAIRSDLCLVANTVGVGMLHCRKVDLDTEALRSFGSITNLLCDIDKLLYFSKALIFLFIK